MAVVGDKPQCDLYATPTARKIGLKVCCDFGIILFCCYCLNVLSVTGVRMPPPLAGKKGYLIRAALYSE